MFMLSISLFVAVTTALLVYIIVFQQSALNSMDYRRFAMRDVWITFALQGQTIMAESVRFQPLDDCVWLIQSRAGSSSSSSPITPSSPRT